MGIEPIVHVAGSRRDPMELCSVSMASCVDSVGTSEAPFDSFGSFDPFGSFGSFVVAVVAGPFAAWGL